jgi:dTDP-4-amino-4,6-dideoxygalactose transaminase
MNVGTGVHYPLINEFKLYQDLGYNSSNTPVAKRISSAILTLPLFPLMSLADVERVVSALELALHEI